MFPEMHRASWTRLLLAAILCVHLALLVYGAWQDAPVLAEVQQLPAGLYHWKYSRFDFADVNPPLVRMIAALPVSLMSPTVNWEHSDARFFGRSEYEIGRKFVEANSTRCQEIFFVGRCACIPFSLLGAILCWSWAKQLYGELAGLLAATLWCFSPWILGHGHLISADLAGATMALTVAYSVSAWLRTGTWRRATLAGLVLGVAQLTKFTLLIAYPLILIWTILFSVFAKSVAAAHPRAFHGRPARDLCQCALVFLLSIYVLDLGYAFDGMPFRPCDEVYKSRTFKPWGATLTTDREPGAARRRPGCGLWLPFPRSYIRGLDEQKAVFDEPSNSFLAGQWKKGGWWYYYLYGLGIKTPLGTLGLALCAVLTLMLPRRFRRSASTEWREEVVLLSLVLGIMFVVSSQYNMSCHLRYAIPLLGAFFVLVSRAVPVVGSGSLCGTLVIAGCTTWMVGSSLWQYPHSLGYFNELVGGPEEGHRYLNHSNVDWGQDLYYLRKWYDRHPDARPLFLSVDCLYNPESLGIRYSRPYKFAGDQYGDLTEERDRGAGPKPGWYAVSKNNLRQPDRDYTYLLSCEQVATVGSAINIYHLSLSDANRIRMAHSLPLLPADWELQKKNAMAMETVLVKELNESLVACRARSSQVRVAVLHFQYAPEVGDGPEQEMCRGLREGIKCSCDVITVDAVRAGALRSVDVLLVPGGSSELMARALGPEGRDAIRRFLQQGSGYVGICAGAFLATRRFEGCLGVVEATLLDGTCEDPRNGRISMAERGNGLVTCKFTDSGRAVLGGSQDVVSARYSGGPVFQDDVLDKVPSYVTLATYLSELSQCERQKGTMVQTPAAVAGSFGRGHFILFGFHPESSTTTEGILLLAIEGVCPRRGSE